MGSTILYMSMSLDGFIAGPNDEPGNGLGDDGDRLHEWALKGADAAERGVPELVTEGVNGQVAAEFMATGAVVAGRRTFEMAAAGAATTTTACRSSSSRAASRHSTFQTGRS